MSMVTNILSGVGAFNEVCRALQNRQSPIYLSGASHIHRAHFTAGLAEEGGVLSGAPQHDHSGKATGIATVKAAGIAADGAQQSGYYDIPAVLVVSDSEANARRLADDVNILAKKDIAAHLPAKDFAFISSEAVSHEYEAAAIGTLSNLVSGNIRVVSASIEALMQFTIPKSVLKKNTITIKNGDTIDSEELTARLIAAGYTRTERVEGVSQFARRGDIFDVFPVNEKFPVRFEFWGDEVDTAAYFDIDSQRRTGDIIEIVIPPARTVLFENTDEQIKKLETLSEHIRGKKADLIKEHLLRDIKTLRDFGEGFVLGNIDKYLPLAYEKPALLTDYLPDGSLVIINEHTACEQAARGIIAAHREDLAELTAAGEMARFGAHPDYLCDFPHLEEIITDTARFNALYMDAFVRGGGRYFKTALSLNAGQTAVWGGEIRQLIDDLRILKEQSYTVFVYAGSEKTLPLIQKDLAEEGLFAEIVTDQNVLHGNESLTPNKTENPSAYAPITNSEHLTPSTTENPPVYTSITNSEYLTPGTTENDKYRTAPETKADGAENINCYIYLSPSVNGLSAGGFYYPEAHCALITQSVHQTSKRKLKKKNKHEEIKSLTDLSTGDLIVHALHGIGRFDGIRKLEMEGVTKDYITIRYAGTDVLYVPVNQLDIVSKYIGPGGKNDNETVRLNKLSSDVWQKQKAKVRAAVKDMADELIALYARRAQTPGHSFPADDDLIADFESRFPYTETDDQLTSTAEIKADMERPVPMDRLLCGDVGFGKTEVAFRAAFKCVEEGKQCALLAPTTVLAWQHYQTALRRFEGFPIRIQLLSRFRTAAEQRRIKANLADGKIDLIIGTHMLVQKGVKFPDLGLVIIDEEQRFGVAHKERFKQYFAGVDVLTLSATPIPRTLNMAMSGIRDMSVLEEAPVDRHPVQTYVLEYDMGVVTQALQKELRRGGQVYYIHNRIDSIDRAAARIAEALPEARIGIAHGRMEEEELSEIWQRLVEHEIDILVCTTLIETGVDVPNCNTLVIEDADRFGLSQLYQLRGRVGRSARRAFAYFTFKRGKNLSEIASKRLDAIREFTRFGSGFRIAMRDLEIRGAGSLLGARQHGHMETVGYDMYLQILSEVMAEQKGETPAARPEDCLIDLQIDAHIPESYIASLADRLDIYRKIASLKTNEDSVDLIDELIDRFGDPPKSIEGLITVSLVRNKAAAAGVTEITQKNDIMFFYIKSAEPENISRLVTRFKRRVTVNSGIKPHIAMKLAADKPLALVQGVIEILSEPV